MVNQYPYQLVIQTIQDPIYDEESGSWTEETTIEEDYVKCRDDSNSAGSVIQTTDGEEYVFSYVIYMPFGTKPIELGSKVKVLNGNELRAEGRVKKFYKGQLHSILWL